jgi:hypothetical protein
VPDSTKYPWILAGLLSLVGCATNKDQMARAKVLERATFDLQCTDQGLTVEKLSDDHQMMGVKNSTWGARGCDRQASYKASCGLGNCQIISDAQASRQ